MPRPKPPVPPVRVLVRFPPDLLALVDAMPGETRHGKILEAIRAGVIAPRVEPHAIPKDIGNWPKAPAGTPFVTYGASDAVGDPMPDIKAVFPLGRPKAKPGSRLKKR